MYRDLIGARQPPLWAQTPTLPGSSVSLLYPLSVLVAPPPDPWRAWGPTHHRRSRLLRSLDDISLATSLRFGGGETDSFRPRGGEGSEG